MFGKKKARMYQTAGNKKLYAQPMYQENSFSLTVHSRKVLGKACLIYVNLDLGYYCTDLFIKKRNSTDINNLSMCGF